MKNVSKLEIKNNLKETIETNASVLDTLNEWKRRCKDILGYNDEDIEAKESLETLEYIIFCFEYLDNQYRTAYKKYGGKL